MKKKIRHLTLLVYPEWGRRLAWFRIPAWGTYNTYRTLAILGSNPSDPTNSFIMIWTLFDLLRRIDLTCVSDKKSEK